jgi:2'-phosphotransferase
LAWQPLRSLKVTFDDIRTAVVENDKQRLSMKPNPETNHSLDETSTDPAAWLIRANQGHSIKLDSEALLKPLTLEAGNIPSTVIHGTYFAFWNAIVESGGLKRMGRNHVHCSTGLPDTDSGVVSGMRKDAELVVYVDVEQSLKDGAMTWWISENGVVLTEGDAEGTVPSRYFKEVVGRKQNVGTLWKDGEKVADLPAGVKGIVPQGKQRGPRGTGGRGRGRGGGRAGGSVGGSAASASQ